MTKTTISFEDLRQLTLRFGGFDPRSSMSISTALEKMRHEFKVTAWPLLEHYAKHIEELHYAKN